MSRNYQSDSWKFDFLKTSIFAVEASLLGQIFVLISAGKLSAHSSSTEALYCLISVQWPEVVDKIEMFPKLGSPNF